MNIEQILTDEQIIGILEEKRPEYDGLDKAIAVSRAIEQAVLQSPEIQGLRKDAELFQFILKEAWFQKAFVRFDPDDNGDQSEFESECRRFLIAAMEQKT